MSIKTTVVGSYPLPDWLAALPSEQALADAMRIVIHTQEQAGLDVVCDGELYRFDVNHPQTNGMSAGLDNFAPRVGGVFRLDEKTVFRSGYGITYNAQAWARAVRGDNDYPVTIAGTFQNAEQFVDNTAQVFLGTALKCASCHNHFLNPDWTLVDFYGYANYFSPTNLELVRCEEKLNETVPMKFILGDDAGLPESADLAARLRNDGADGDSADRRPDRLRADALAEPAQPRMADTLGGGRLARRARVGRWDRSGRTGRFAHVGSFPGARVLPAP